MLELDIPRPEAQSPSQRRKPIPGKGNPNAIRSFLEHVAEPNTSHRIERFRTWEQARLYWQDQQWLEEDFTEDATRTPFWKPLEMSRDSWFPTPVQNEMVAPIRNECARLMGVGSRPYIPIDKRTPEAMRSAKLGESVLDSKLYESNWEELQYEGLFHGVSYGTWILVAGWETNFLQTEPQPVKGLVACSSCGYKLASAEVPHALAEEKGILDKPTGFRIEEQELGANPLMAETKVTAESCPHCGSEGSPEGNEQPSGALEPYVLPEEERQAQAMDALGRPMTEDVPIGDIFLRNASVFDTFPENSGIDLPKTGPNEVAEARIVTIDWLLERYDNAHLVKAEDVQNLLRWHPIVGGSNHFYGGGQAADPAMFDHHALLRTWAKKPWIEYDPKTKKRWANKGRFIAMAGNVLLADTDLMIEGRSGKLLPRIMYEFWAWDLRDREIWGMSMSEWMFSAQDSINTRKAQVEYVRHVFGNPKLLVPEGADLTYAGFADSQYPSDIYYYKDVGGGLRPEPLSGMQLGTTWNVEENVDLESLQRRTGTFGTDVGDPPTGVDAASALMYIGEKADEQRAPRHARLRAMKSRVYSYMLELAREFYTEERHYTKTNARGDQESIEAFRGEDLTQTKVRVKDERAYDQRLFKRESLKLGVSLGTIDLSDERSKKAANELLDIPMDIDADRNIQVDKAEGEWLRFRRDSVEPVIDPRLDDDMIHYKVHASTLLSDEAEEMKAALDWNEITLALWDWEKEFEKLQMLSDLMDQKGPPPPEPPPPEAQVNPMTGQEVPPSPERAQLALQAHEQHVQAWERIQGLPKAIELRIFTLWQGILQTELPPPTPPASAPTLDPVTGAVFPGQPMLTPEYQAEAQAHEKRMTAVLTLLRFAAHMEAHYYMAQKEQQAAMMGAMAPAAPGAAEGPTGAMPTPDEMVSPGAGTGDGVTTAGGTA